MRMEDESKILQSQTDQHCCCYELPRRRGGKESAANAGDMRETGSVPGSERSPGEGNGSALQYSCLESLMDRGAWRATVHGVAKSRNN